MWRLFCGVCRLLGLFDWWVWIIVWSVFMLVIDRGEEVGVCSWRLWVVCWLCVEYYWVFCCWEGVFWRLEVIRVWLWCLVVVWFRWVDEGLVSGCGFVWFIVCVLFRCWLENDWECRGISLECWCVGSCVGLLLGLVFGFRFSSCWWWRFVFEGCWGSCLKCWLWFVYGWWLVRWRVWVWGWFWVLCE